MRSPATALRVDLVATLHTIAVLIRWISVTLALPIVVAIIYGDSVMPFVVPLVGGFGLGMLVEHVTRGCPEIGLREGTAAVALGWLVAAALAAVPYVIEGGDISRPIDAYFEAMSGLTSTGASVMATVESHSHAILFWRALTAWMGGMGIVVLAVAILPRLSTGGNLLFESEASGTNLEKLTPHIRETARRLWLIYLGMTAALISALWLVGALGKSPGMGLYQAATHSFATMATGGFSSRNRSLEPFGAWAQWIVILFMVLAAINFGLWYRTLFRDRRALWRDDEVRLFLAILAVASAIVAVDLHQHGLFGIGGSIRHAIFQVVTIGSTTGFASTDFATWPALTWYVLVLLMLVGGCAGSTAGAIKVVRVRLVARLIRREVRQAVHPELVEPIRLSGTPVSEGLARSAAIFVLLYLAIFLLASLLLLVDADRIGLHVLPIDALAAAATALGTVGPGLGQLGPMASFAPLSDPSTGLLIALMWAGRLELIPVLMLLSRSFWRR